MNEFDLALFSAIVQILPELLKDHPYGVYELARDLARQLHQPICEVMTPLTEALHEMAKTGELSYNRATNQMTIFSSAHAA
jgi:hypothetical protein